MDLLIAIGVGLVIVLVGFLLIPYLQDKGWFKNGLVTQKQLLKLAEVIVKEADLKNKSLYVAVVEASQHAVDYAEQMASQKDLTDKEKKELALETAQKILEVAEVKLDKNTLEAVDIFIEVAVNNLPRNKEKKLKGKLDLG